MEEHETDRRIRLAIQQAAINQAYKAGMTWGLLVGTLGGVLGVICYVLLFGPVG